MTKELEERIELLQRKIKGLQKTIIVLNDAVGKQNSLREENERLKEEKNSQNQTLSVKEKELESKKEELKQLEEKIEDLNKKETDYKRQIRDLNLKIEDANDEKEKDDKKIKDLQEEKIEAEKNLEKAQQDLNSSEEKRKELRRNINDLQDNLRKLRNEKSAELDEWVNKNTELNRDLIEANDRIDKLNRELRELKSQQSTNENDEKIKILEKEKQELQEKREKLEEKVKKITRQFLDTKLSDLWSRITSLISDLNISARDIRQKYGGDYGEILTKEATLENIELLEETLRVIIGICSIERTERISQEIEKQAKPSTATLASLQENLGRNKENWEQISPNISKENNPLYLPIVDKQDDYRKKTEKLIERWGNRASTRSMIDLRMGGIESDDWDIAEVKHYQDLTKTKTIFGVSAAATRKKVDDYFKWLKTEYSSLENEINERQKTIESELQKCFNKNGISTNDIGVNKLLHRALEDSDLVEKFKGVAEKKVDELFGIKAVLDFEEVEESEMISLKTSLKDHIRTVLDYGADDIAFLVSCLYKEIYLKYLPGELEKYLQQDPEVKLSELSNDAWSAEKNNLFVNFFDKLQNVNRKEDLDLFELNVNKSCRKLMKMIREIKETRVEPDSELCRDPNHSDTPEEAQKKVRQHLEEVEKNWKELIKRISTNSEDSDVLMFKKWYERGKNSEILPFIKEALKSQGKLVNYQQLNKEWGEGIINTEGEVEYNADRDYFGAWSTFRVLLKGWEKSVENNKLSEVVERILGPDYPSLILIETIK